MTRCLTLLCVGLCAALAASIDAVAALIPASASWTCVPAQTVGVPGGIPWRTNVVTVTPTNADVSAELNAALTSCPSNGVVYLPAGVYVYSNYIGFPNYKSLRGDGTNTVIKPRGEFVNIVGASGGENLSAEVLILSGYESGSSNLLLSAALDAAKYVGGVAHLFQSNAPDVFMTGGYEYRQGQYVGIAAIAGSNMTIWPPLCWAMSNGLSPRLIADCYWDHVKRVGVENLVIDAEGITGNGIPVNFDHVRDSWLTNVTIRNFRTYGVQLINALQCEVRHCDIRDAQGSGNNHAGIIAYYSSGLHLEDNIITNVQPSIEFMGLCSANAVSYNYADKSDDGSNEGATMSPSHSNHNHHNLWEGNKTQKVQFDQNDGTGSDDTVFRNWITGTNAYVTDYWCCLDVKHWYRRLVACGNVLGAPGKSWTLTAPTTNSVYASHYIYAWGDPAIGYWEANAPWDAATETTSTVLLNYDYATAGIPAAQQSAETLPDSVMYSSTPSWWPSGLAWPPFAPDATTNRIPAELRFLGLAGGGAGGGDDGSTNGATGTLVGSGLIDGSGVLTLGQ